MAKTELTRTLNKDERREWNLRLKTLEDKATSFVDFVLALWRIKHAKLYEELYGKGGWSRFCEEHVRPLLEKHRWPSAGVAGIDKWLELKDFSDEVTCEYVRRILPPVGGTTQAPVEVVPPESPSPLPSDAEYRLLKKLPKEHRPVTYVDAVVKAQGRPKLQDIERLVEARLLPEVIDVESEGVVYRDKDKVEVPDNAVNLWLFRTDDLDGLLKEIRSLKRRLNALRTDECAAEFPVQAMQAALHRADEIGSPFVRSRVCKCETGREPCPLCHGTKLMPDTCLAEKTGPFGRHEMNQDQQKHLEEFGDLDADYPQLPYVEASRRISCYFTGRWAKRKKKAKVEPPPEF